MAPVPRKSAPQRPLGLKSIRIRHCALVGTAVWLLVLVIISVERYSEPAPASRLVPGHRGLKKIGVVTRNNSFLLPPSAETLASELRVKRSAEKGDTVVEENGSREKSAKEAVEILVRRVAAEAAARRNGARDAERRAQLLQRALVMRGMSELQEPQQQLSALIRDSRTRGRADVRALMKDRELRMGVRGGRRTLENLGEWPLVETPDPGPEKKKFLEQWKQRVAWPPRNNLTRKLEEMNRLGVRNADRLPGGVVPQTGIIMVLYVHKRAHYLKSTLEALEKVKGIREILLIVSHDGFFPEVDALIKAVRFCGVKQIYAPLSPHNFQGTFPAASPGDCVGKVPNAVPCEGHPDHFGNYREPSYVSLKHHWWWLMNTVWDGLPETKNFWGHMMFVEEDHFVMPNALQTMTALVRLKNQVCVKCSFANLAPSNVKVHLNQGTDGPVVEQMSNIGYAFNRSVWGQLHNATQRFCNFDDYNWDMSVWSLIQGRWKAPLTIRSPRASAWHVGGCGLHTGIKRHVKLKACENDVVGEASVSAQDEQVNINEATPLRLVRYPLRMASFRGWGGWGDYRDHELCEYFSSMYRGDNFVDSRRL